jgi:hypothetical protein
VTRLRARKLGVLSPAVKQPEREADHTSICLDLYVFMAWYLVKPKDKFTWYVSKPRNTFS